MHGMRILQEQLIPFPSAAGFPGAYGNAAHAGDALCGICFRWLLGRDCACGAFLRTEAAVDAGLPGMGLHGHAAVFPVGAVPGKGEGAPVCRGFYFGPDRCCKSSKLFSVFHIRAPGGILAHDGMEMAEEGNVACPINPGAEVLEEGIRFPIDASGQLNLLHHLVGAVVKLPGGDD